MDERGPRRTTRPVEQLAPRTFKPLPEAASIEQIVQALHEMATAYAAIAANAMDVLPQFRADLDEMRVVQEAHGIRIDKLELWRSSLQALPPMRPESASTADVARHGSKEIGERVVAEIRDKSTPPPSAEKVAAISEEVLRAAIVRVKQEESAAKWEALEHERKSAEAERVAVEKQAQSAREALAVENAQAKNKAKWAIILAGAMGIGTIVRELVEWALRSHSP